MDGRCGSRVTVRATERGVPVSVVAARFSVVTDHGFRAFRTHVLLTSYRRHDRYFIDDFFLDEIAYKNAFHSNLFNWTKRRV
jgi:hypothetical protein